MCIYVFLSAFGGGVIRALVGWIKHYFSYKNVKFKPGYFVGLMVTSGVIGLVAVWAVKGIGFEVGGGVGPALAFIVGYGGGDFVENVYKIIIKKSSLYEE